MAKCWVVEEDYVEGTATVRICATEALARREKLLILRRARAQTHERIAKMRSGQMKPHPGESFPQMLAYQFEWMRNLRKALSVQEVVFFTE